MGYTTMAMVNETGQIAREERLVQQELTQLQMELVVRFRQRSIRPPSGTNSKI